MYFIECATPAELVHLCERLALNTTSGEWYFRGQGDSTWGLKPSIFRATPPIANPQHFEATVAIRIRLLLEHSTTMPMRFSTNRAHLLALAQHYGTPTRLLDWTSDPDVALYFAASGALRERPKSGRCSVFATGAIHLDIDPGKPATWLATPGAGNPNLVAQRGRLVLQKWGREDLWDWSAAKPTTDAVKNVGTGLIDARLLRIDLPTEQADEALFFLSRRGVRASALFPGEAGIAREAEDDARCAIHGAEKRGDELAMPLDWNGEKDRE